MAGRHHGRGFVQNPYPENENSNALRSYSPSGRYHYRRPRPTPGFGKPHAYTQTSNRPHPGDGTSNYYDDDEDDDDEQPRQSNDNPLYELEDDDSRLSLPAAPEQGNPNNNPLYGNDPFKAIPAETVCMTEFLRPKGQQRYSLRPRSKKPRKFDEYGPEFISTSKSDHEDASDERPPAPPSRSPSPRRPKGTAGYGLFQSGDEKMMKSYPPARFSPVMPGGPPTDSGTLVSSPKGKRINQGQAATTSAQSPKSPPQFGGQSIMDVIAAVRSDQNLLIAEVRRDGGREPRIPGDHDRYFAPRKGDIIVHFTPTLDKNKLVEYFDEKMTMLRLQPGDKLVRVKYDNYKIPDHLMITSKLYIYAPEWVYLGKAVQTIKTA